MNDQILYELSSAAAAIRLLPNNVRVISVYVGGALRDNKPQILVDNIRGINGVLISQEFSEEGTHKHIYKSVGKCVVTAVEEIPAETLV